MSAANGNRHPPDPNSKRVAAERAKMERFNRHAFVKSKVAQAVRFGFAKR